MDAPAIIVTTPEELTRIIIVSMRSGLEEIRKAVHAEQNRAQGKKLLDAKDVEAEYGIGKRKLERWRAEGIGPQYTTVGRLVYYERAVLEAFFANGRVQTTGRAEQ